MSESPNDHAKCNQKTKCHHCEGEFETENHPWEEDVEGNWICDDCARHKVPEIEKFGWIRDQQGFFSCGFSGLTIETDYSKSAEDVRTKIIKAVIKLWEISPWEA